MVNELEIEIDGVKVSVPQGATVMDAARKLGLFIPHFCYHPQLSIAANCRMCLIDVEKSPKPLPACATPATPGLKVWTRSQRAVDAQQSVMRFILINHPLDCPICDQGGECALQDVAMGYGATSSSFSEEKRVVKNKNLGPLISTDMTRCIYCTRCVRFGQEVAGLTELGVAGRGEHSEIMTFMSEAVTSEISGNVIDLCPVGALTSKPFYYSARSWELSRRLSVSAHDSLGSNLIVQTKLGCVYRVLPFENPQVNECWLSDRDRFSYLALQHDARLTTPMLRKEGAFVPISWEEALAVLLKCLSPCLGEQATARLGTLVHPMATAEELYLLRCLHEHVGSQHLHAYLGHADHRLAGTRGVNWLGLSLADLEQCDHVFIVGSFLRHEQPLLAARLRRLARSGLAMHRLAVSADDWLMPLKTDCTLDPADWVSFLSLLLVTVMEEKGQSVDAHLFALVSESVRVAYGDTIKHLAQALLSARMPALFLGDFADKHPDATLLHALTSRLAQCIQARFGFLGFGANYVVSSVLSLCAPEHPLDADLSVLCLFHTEPHYDCSLTREQKERLSAIESVISFSCYYDPADTVSDLLLPIASFMETEGTFVNIAGTVQTVRPTVRPLGDIKPAWKVLKVLLERLGYAQASAYTSCASIREEMSFLSDISSVLGDNAYLADTLPEVCLKRDAVSQHAVRYFSYTPVYMVDSIVRRSAALQQTMLSTAVLTLSSALSRQLGVAAGDYVRVSQESATVELPVQVSEVLPDDVVLLPRHHLTVDFVGSYGFVHLERI